jgi:hypothetical protein
MQLKYEDDIEAKEWEIQSHEAKAAAATSEIEVIEGESSELERQHKRLLGAFAEKKRAYNQKMGDISNANFENLIKFTELLERDGCQLYQPLQPQPGVFNKVDSGVYTLVVLKALHGRHFYSKAAQEVMEMQAWMQQQHKDEKVMVQKLLTSIGSPQATSEAEQRASEAEQKAADLIERNHELAQRAEAHARELAASKQARKLAEQESFLDELVQAYPRRDRRSA